MRWMIAICLFCVLGCKSDMVDPKNPTRVPSGTVFLEAEKAFFDTYTSASRGTAPFRVLAQEWTENTYVYEAVYDFSEYQAPDGWWNAWYGNVLHNLENARGLFPTDVADPAQLRHSEDITDILEVYAYYLLSTTYGDIPYSQAEKDTIPFPVYDDARSVYKDLFVRLDSSRAGLAMAGGSIPPGAEQVYGGNPGEWIKFGATLELKMALLAADVDPVGAQAWVMDALAAGVFTSNADNAILAYDPSSPENSSPVWQALVNSGRHDFCPAGLLVGTLLEWEDPRLPFYFGLDGFGAYSGGTPGAGNGYGSVSDFSSLLQQPAFPGDILDYPETEFLLAEAAARGMPVSGTAGGYYDNAVAAGVGYWSQAAGRSQGNTDTAIDLYLSLPWVAYGTAQGAWRQKIGYQTWIAAYARNWDAWTEIRRLGYPDLDSVSPPLGAHGRLPLRLTYPVGEQTNNAANWRAAVGRLAGGQDILSARLWWE